MILICSSYATCGALISYSALLYCVRAFNTGKFRAKLHQCSIYMLQHINAARTM